MNEQEAKALVAADYRERGSGLADEPWEARPFRGGWYLTPERGAARRMVGSNGLIVTDDGRIHTVGSIMPATWGMARHLPDDGPNRRSEADALVAARLFGEAEGGDLVGHDWVGTRFTGGWLLVPRAQIEHRPSDPDERVGVVVFDNGVIRRERIDWPLDMVAARCAAELEFGGEPPG